MEWSITSCVFFSCFPVINIYKYKETKMKKATYDKANRKYTVWMVLGIIVLASLILVSIAGAVQSTNVWSHKGSELMNSEKYDEAIKAYDKAIEINPLDSRAWYYRGVALSELGKFDEAQKYFAKVKEINSKTWYNKGIALGKLGKPDEAIKAFDKAIESNPQDSYAWYYKGVALNELGKSDEAQKAWVTGKKIESKAWHNKGLAILKLNEADL